MIAAWVLLGLIVAFLALNAWADTGDAIAEDAGADGDDGAPLADTPATRIVIIAVGLVVGVAGLGLEGVMRSVWPDPAAPARCVEVPEPVATPADPAVAEALAALRRQIESGCR